MRKTKNVYFSMGSLALYLVMTLFLCSCADLVVKNIHSAPFIGATRIVKGTVKNKGMKAAPASKTSVAQTANLSDPYTQVATVYTPPLRSGEERELYLIFDPGYCIHLKVCADCNDDVAEGQLGEGNNCTLKSIGCQ